jgi:hypothetical protein
MVDEELAQGLTTDAGKLTALLSITQELNKQEQNINISRISALEVCLKFMLRYHRKKTAFKHPPPIDRRKEIPSLSLPTQSAANPLPA